MKKKVIAMSVAGLMLASFAVGCSANTTSTNTANTSSSTNISDLISPKNESAIDKIVVGTLASIDNAIATEYNYEMLSSGVSTLPLVYQDVEGEFHPLLAEATTDDSLTWTYTVMPDMMWSDGVMITAEDIAFTLEFEDMMGSANLVDQQDSEGKTTKAKYTAYTISDDKRSISLTLASENVRELANMTSFRTLPKHALEGKENPTDEDLRISSGPYVLDNFDKNSGTLTFVKNEYYPATPNVDTIEYHLFSSEDTMYMSLINGDLDMVWNYSQGVSSSYQDVLANENSVNLLSVSASNEPAVLTFNNAKGPFADINLRKAVVNALDYNEFKTYFGSALAEIPNAGFVPTSTVGFKKTEKLSHDQMKATNYMQKAGYVNKNDDGFYVDENGKVCEFTLTVNSAKTAHLGYAELVKTQLEKFGIKVNLEQLDSDSYNAKTSNKFSENNITMDAAIFGYTVAGMGMGNGLGSIYVDGNHAVQGGAQVYDDVFSAILTEMSNSKTMDEYKKGASKLQDYYAENSPLVALYWDNMVHAVSSKYDNVVVDYTFGLNNVNNWFNITKK